MRSLIFEESLKEEKHVEEVASDLWTQGEQGNYDLPNIRARNIQDLALQMLPGSQAKSVVMDAGLVKRWDWKQDFHDSKA